MPVSAPELTARRTITSSAPDNALTEWLTPFDVAGETVQPRVDAPRFIYRGDADEHLSGQSCYADPETLALGESVNVIMACGCRLSVPWWSLEPVTIR